jgi:hypothetical protein
MYLNNDESTKGAPGAFRLIPRLFVLCLLLLLLQLLFASALERKEKHRIGQNMKEYLKKARHHENGLR